MRTGHLDQRITIEALQGTLDDYGQPVNEWGTFLSTWAAVEPLQGREYFAADAAQSEVTARIRTRYRPGITSQDRVIHDGKTYNIVTVIDVRSEHRELVLMCKRVG